MEGFITAIIDLFPNQLRKGYNREYFAAGYCFVSFLVGLSMVSYVGISLTARQNNSCTNKELVLMLGKILFNSFSNCQNEGIELFCAEKVEMDGIARLVILEYVET